MTGSGNLPPGHNGSVWMGLARDGSPLQITHEKLMRWAFDNDQQFQVGWSNAVTLPDGARLVRGSFVEEALKAGWADIAKALSQFFKSEAAHG